MSTLTSMFGAGGTTSDLAPNLWGTYEHMYGETWKPEDWNSSTEHLPGLG
jgi:hypothetical protein